MHQIPPENIDVLKYQESLKSWLRQYPQFSDYDFEGTNFSVLISLLAYNAYSMAHYANMVGNEAWVDTAQLRQSLVSHATDLNYLPRSMTSAHAVLEVEVFPHDNPSSIILPKYYKFKSATQDGQTIYFVTDQDYIAARDDQGRYVFRNVNVYQGEISEEYFLVDGVEIVNGLTTYNNQFVISSESIDIKSLEVFVKSTPESATATKYTYAPTLAETSNITNTYFIRGIYDNQYAIEFGNGVFGAPLANGNQVIARFRNTLGPVIQGNYTLTKTTDISGYSDIVVNSSTRVQGGFDRESIEEIRTNAPRHFQTQDRAVTHIDYENIVRSNFPNIQQVSAFGGELVEQYGKVFIVIKPYGTQGIVSNIIKTQIVELLKSKNIVPEPIVIDPNYYYLHVSGTVFYKGDIVTLTEQQLRANIITNLVALNDDAIKGIGDFNKNIYQSLLNDTIKGSDGSIVGSDVGMELRKRWTPQTNINETLNFTTNNPFRVSHDGAFSSPSDYTLITNDFQAFIGGSIQTVNIQDDGVGNLHFYINQGEGAKIRTGSAIGTIDYERGAVRLTANVYNYNNYIEFTIKLRNKSFASQQESFVIIDGKDIEIDFKRL